MWIGLLLPSSGTSAVSVTVASKPHASCRLPPAPTDESPHDDDGGRSATSGDAASSNPRQSAERSTTTAVAVVRRGIAERDECVGPRRASSVVPPTPFLGSPMRRACCRPPGQQGRDTAEQRRRRRSAMRRQPAHGARGASYALLPAFMALRKCSVPPMGAFSSSQVSLSLTRATGRPTADPRPTATARMGGRAARSPARRDPGDPARELDFTRLSEPLCS